MAWLPRHDNKIGSVDTGAIVDDNQPDADADKYTGTALDGGSIVVHTGK